MAFRGASADAAAAVGGILSAGVKSAADSGRIAGELFAVAGILRGEPGLRRVATDVSVDADARARLLRQLLGTKIDDGTLRVVDKAVRQRWTAPRDLADALEHVGVVAAAHSAAAEGDRLSNELFTVAQVVGHNPELRDALSDPARSLADKQALVRQLLAGRALPATVDLVEQALTGSHRTVGVALAEYQKVVADVQGQRVATVRVARPLGEADRERLVAALSAKYARPVHVNEVVDPEVIGGIRVDIGDDVIDGTVANKLDSARRKLAG